MDTGKIQVVDSEGNEIEFEVLFTFDNEENGKKYVLYYDPNEEEGSVFASIYDDEGKLYEVEDPKDWAMIEEVFESFMAQGEDEEESEGCGCGGHGHHHHKDGECCGGHHHEDGECCGGHDHGDCDCKN